MTYSISNINVKSKIELGNIYLLANKLEALYFCFFTVIFKEEM